MEYKIIKVESLTFEKAMERINQINNFLENDNVELEKALKMYEEGKELIHFCQNKLSQVSDQLKKINVVYDKDDIKSESVD